MTYDECMTFHDRITVKIVNINRRVYLTDAFLDIDCREYDVKLGIWETFIL